MVRQKTSLRNHLLHIRETTTWSYSSSRISYLRCWLCFGVNDLRRELALVALLTACSGGGGGTARLPAGQVGGQVGLAEQSRVSVQNTENDPALPAPNVAPPAAVPVLGGTTKVAPVNAPKAGGINFANSSSKYTNIRNGQEYPIDFRPYHDASPWNAGTYWAQRDNNLTGVLQANASHYLSGSSGPPSGQAGSNDYSHPVYTSSNSDPTVTATCGQYGCWHSTPNAPWNTRVSSLQLHIPPQARPAGGSDAHMGVIQPNGSEVDCWGTNYSGGSSLSAQICAEGPVTGFGIRNPSTTSGAALLGGIVRQNELRRGWIPHALFLVADCTNGVIYPGTSASGSCNGTLPIGAWIHLRLTQSQINALPASAGNRAVLDALSYYGGYIMDNGGVGSKFAIMYESPQYYASFGQPYPTGANGTMVNWSTLASNMEVLTW